MLEIDSFPPRAETLEALLAACEDLALGRIYLKCDQFFPWSFDTSIRDRDAYPEELMYGFTKEAERGGVLIVPAVSTLFIEEALSRRFSPDVEDDMACESLRGPATAYCGELFEDLATLFLPAKREVLLFEDDSAPSRRSWCIDAAREQEIDLGRASRAALKLWNYLSETGVRGRARLAIEESVWALPFYGGEQGALPELPGWLALLPETYDERRRALLEGYGSFARALDTAWRNLRLRWEAAVRNHQRRCGDPENEATRVHRLAGELIGAGSPLFLPPWFKGQIQSRERAYLAALLHQQAGDYSIIPPVNPMIE